MSDGCTPAMTPSAEASILLLSPIGGYGGFNTSVHRMDALASIFASLEVVDSTEAHQSRWGNTVARLRAWLFRRGFDVRCAGTPRDAGRLLDAAMQRGWDVIWLEKALTIDARTVRELRRACPRACIIGFSPDDMSARHNQSAQFLDALPLYDAFLTTKSYNVAELAAAGCGNVMFVGNGYDPVAFRPVAISDDDRRRLGGDIGFIGSFEAARFETMQQLADAGLHVRVWGDGWEGVQARGPNLVIERRPLRGDDFAAACAAFKVNLGFLRRLNRDQQTTRSVEIPACGGFMLAERTDEHRALFVEGVEAEFFGDFEELLRKCRAYLADESARIAVAGAGLRRCRQSGYSNEARLRTALAELGLLRSDAHTRPARLPSAPRGAT